MGFDSHASSLSSTPPLFLKGGLRGSPVEADKVIGTPDRGGWKAGSRPGGLTMQMGLLMGPSVYQLILYSSTRLYYGSRALESEIGLSLHVAHSCITE